MKGLMGFLVKAKLVEPTPEDMPESAQGGEGGSAESAPPPVEDFVAPPVSLPETEGGNIPEGLDLAQLFERAGLPASPFPAEKLLRLLDGLSAMDSDTRKAAVLAMDAADDNWSIADPVQDAVRKIATLQSYKQGLGTQLAAATQQAGDQVAENKHVLENTVAEIRAQIAQLEQLLEREISRSAQEITGIEANLRAAREAVAREQARLDKEIARLGEIPANYDTH